MISCQTSDHYVRQQQTLKLTLMSGLFGITDLLLPILSRDFLAAFLLKEKRVSHDARDD